MNLRDTLLAALTKLPGIRDFHLHVLVTSPRKHSSLFPFAHPRPRSYLQDIVVLLSEQTNPDTHHVFVSAIEASIYNITSTSSAIFYVSKVDSTGQGIAPSPTSTLVRTLLTYYADPATRPFKADHLWVQLFARAQGQYLFPNSSEFEGKHPLSDVKLCAWWKRVYTGVAEDLERRTQSKAKIQLYYILPGSTEIEAIHSLNFASGSGATSSSSTSVSWTYGHPYSQSDIPLPCPGADASKNLGHYIPSFDDDPKSRFVDEIAYTTDADGIKSPAKKRPRTDSADAKKGDIAKNVVRGEVDGELNKVTPDEFWERMSFRQECVAGALTGFFTMIVSSPVTRVSSQSDTSPLAPQAGQVASQMTKRIMTSLLTANEFSTIERSIRATAFLEETIKSLCDGLKPMPEPLTIVSKKPTSLFHPTSDRPKTPEPETGQQLAPPQTPPPRMINGKRIIPDVSPNPFPEPVTSLETYESFIYGSVHVDNPPLAPKARADTGVSTPPVTVLTVRKKKKRT